MLIALVCPEVFPKLFSPCPLDRQTALLYMSAMSKNPHAVALGRKGGKSKSPAKLAAVRANGLKGGRPKSKATT